MAVRSEEVLGGAAGLLGTLVVGAAVLFSGVPISDSAAVTGLWWAAYLVYLVVFAIESETLRPRPDWPVAVTLGLMLVCGTAVWLLAPHLGWTAVLFVVTTATAAFVLPGWAVALVVVGHGLVIAVGGATIAGWNAVDTMFNMLVHVAFMAFAALVVSSTRREQRGRAELAAAHADLRAATALLATSSRDAERLRIARELHDVVGHQLTALALELEVAAHQADGESRDHVLRARRVAKDLLADVRATVSELRHAPAGLEPTLRGVLDVPGLDVDLTVDERLATGESSTIAVVRCVQEIVTNTVRHSGASRLEVRVSGDGDDLVLCAHDDGGGVEQVRPGNGLMGMAERIEELGGSLELDSSPGRGFTVTARVPR